MGAGAAGLAGPLGEHLTSERIERAALPPRLSDAGRPFGRTEFATRPRGPAGATRPPRLPWRHP